MTPFVEHADRGAVAVDRRGRELEVALKRSLTGKLEFFGTSLEQPKPPHRCST